MNVINPMPGGMIVLGMFGLLSWWPVRDFPHTQRCLLSSLQDLSLASGSSGLL
jgi:hypothetical protein